MDVPRTQSGSPCKNCKQKGSPCHLHGGKSSPKKSSPKKKSLKKKSPRKSPKSPNRSQSPKSQSPKFHYLERLPKPALFEVLLNMGPKELKSLLMVPQIASIIKEDRFKRLYDIKHKTSSFTLGKKSIEDGSLIIAGKDGLTFTIKIQEGYLTIIMRSPGMYIEVFFDFRGKETEISIQDSRGEGFIWINVGDNDWEGSENNEDLEERDAKNILARFRKVLTLRDKLEWMPYEEKGEIQINPDFPRELFETIKTVLNKNGIKYDFVWR
jgi:hypothetical protein